MKLNKPSYGVFMVDIFASSVGIFILVTLLYIIESAKATSDEAMVDRFKTLVKRDLVPVDRYSLPIQSDPLHDWGVRARHAREKQEALILLMRDRVLLYHSNQTLSLEEIVDSDILRQYYDKYNKQRRLFVEIHYYDTYHAVKAKIHEALPDNVHQWIHWAYNAGNINNPNPISQSAARPNINLSKGNQSETLVGDENGTPSSVGNSNANADSSGAGMPSEGENQSTGSPSGQIQGLNDGSGTQPQGNESGEGQANPGEGESQGDDANANGDNIPTDVKQEVAKQLEMARDAQAFADQFMAPTPKPERTGDSKNTSKKRDQQQTETSSSNRKSRGGKSPSEAKEPSGESSPGQSTDGVEQATPPPPQLPQQAQEHIKKNVFLAVPLYSPIYGFKLDVRVPGYAHQRFNLNSVGLNLHQAPGEDSPAELLKLNHGDTIVPIDNQLNPGQQNKPAGWMQVQVVKVEGQSKPLTGWFYGHITGEVFMLPLFQNTVQSFETDDYWFKRNSDSLDTFDAIPVQEQQP